MGSPGALLLPAGAAAGSGALLRGWSLLGAFERGWSAGSREAFPAIAFPTLSVSVPKKAGRKPRFKAAMCSGPRIPFLTLHASPGSAGDSNFFFFPC